MPGEGILFILVGPSGAGKNTLMKRVQENLGDLPQLATATTRAKRQGEQEGREHRFVSRAEFQRLIDTGALIEHQPVHGGDLYGAPRKTVEEAISTGRDLVADIEFLGAKQIHEAYPKNTVLVFVTPSNVDILAERIRQRGNITPEALADRLERAKFEMTFAAECDYLILNDIVEPAAEHLRQIILSERIRRRGDHVDHFRVVELPVFHVSVVALLQYEGKLLLRSDPGNRQLPTFPVTDHGQPPHEVLRGKIRETLEQEVDIEAISDERFDFVAPHHIALATIPHDVFLYFYYKCVHRSSYPVKIPGWEWKALSIEDLPSTLNELMVVQP
jgi:guanylate kinase